MKIKIFLFVLICINCFAKCNSQQKASAQKTLPVYGYSYKNASADGVGKFYYDREIAQVMGVAGSDWLDRLDRNEEENADLAIKKIVLPQNAVIADIGAGTGYYSFKLATKVPYGKVFAVELQDEMIAILKSKKASAKDTVVEIVKSTVKNINLPANSIDLAIMVDVYHELEYPQEMLQGISKALKKDGKILLLEYRGEDPAVAIKPLHKTTVGQLNKELSANGFKLFYKGDFLPIQHFLLYEKK